MQGHGVEDGLDEAAVVRQDEDLVGPQPEGNSLLGPDLLQREEQLVRHKLLEKGSNTRIKKCHQVSSSVIHQVGQI